MKKLIINNQSGQAFILATIVLFLLLINTLVIISQSLNFFTNSRYSLDSLKANSLAEAGIDKAVASLNKTGGSYNGELETILGDGSYSVAITSKNASTNIITATGYIPNKTNPKTKRSIQIQVSKGTGIAFNYGVQVGQGGLVMHNNAKVFGSVYSNGNITMDNGSEITGDAFVAGGTQPSADQQNSCSPPNCDTNGFIFGKNVTGNNQLDITQSFRPSSSLGATTVINKVSLMLKKVGNPPNLTIRLLGDNNGKPNKNNIIASGSLTSNLVTSQFGLIDISFSSAPTVNTDTPYWIVIDTSSDNSNYWYWERDTLGTYTNGSAAWSPNWQASNPIWNTISGDLVFQIYMGGVATSITGNNNVTIGKIENGIRSGDAYANTLTNLIINGDAYYQSQSGITAYGQNCNNNTHCHPGSEDLPPKNFPISASNLQVWKDAATSAGTITGNINGCVSTLNAGKYFGDITLTNGCVTTYTSPIWIVGNLSLDNGAIIKLNSSVGAASGVIIVGDETTGGIINLHNNARLQGTETNGSYTMAVSLFDSRTNGQTAIDTDNGSNTSILYAENGIINLHNNASLTEVTGWRLILDNGSSVTYNTGLSGVLFSSGPSGSFSVIKGTYQAK